MTKTHAVLLTAAQIAALSRAAENILSEEEAYSETPAGWTAAEMDELAAGVRQLADAEPQIPAGSVAYVRMPDNRIVRHVVAGFDGDYYVMTCDDGAGWSPSNTTAALPSPLEYADEDCAICFPRDSH